MRLFSVICGALGGSCPKVDWLLLGLALSVIGLSFAGGRVGASCAAGGVWGNELQPGRTGLKTWRKSFLISRMSASIRAKRSSYRLSF